MKLKFLFFFLALLLTAVWTILLVLTLKERGALFYIGEGVITFSLVFLVYFYRKVVKPLDIIGNGMELLREQDFSSRLTPVGQKEADRIVLVFNRMMEQLKERLFSSVYSGGKSDFRGGESREKGIRKSDPYDST